MWNKFKKLLSLIAQGVNYSSNVISTGGNVSTMEAFGMIRG